MKNSEPLYGDGDFKRSKFAFEASFFQGRNEWVHDKKITGNAFSLLIFLVSLHPEQTITQEYVRKGLGLGREAYKTARMKLVEAGYLKVTTTRYPAGTLNHLGESIAGHKKTHYELIDPFETTKTASEPVDKALSGNQTRQQNVDNLPKNVNNNVDKLCVSVDNESLVRKPTEGKPSTVFQPLIKTNNDLKLKSSSTLQTLEKDDDDVFRKIHPHLTKAALLHALRKHHQIPEILDLPRAATTILERAKHANVHISSVAAYVASSVAKNPAEWIKNEPKPVKTDAELIEEKRLRQALRAQDQAREKELEHEQDQRRKLLEKLNWKTSTWLDKGAPSIQELEQYLKEKND